MRINKFMLISGLLLAIGGSFVLPVIFGAIFSLVSEDKINRYFTENPAFALPALIASIVIVVSPTLIGMFLAFGAFIFPLIAHRKAQRNILREGQSANAKILALSDTGTRINDNPLVSISLEVYSPTQPAFRAEVSQVVSIIHLPSFQPGKIVNVKYIPGTNQIALI